MIDDNEIIEEVILDVSAMDPRGADKPPAFHFSAILFYILAVPAFCCLLIGVFYEKDFLHVYGFLGYVSTTAGVFIILIAYVVCYLFYKNSIYFYNFSWLNFIPAILYLVFFVVADHIKFKELEFYIYFSWIINCVWFLLYFKKMVKNKILFWSFDCPVFLSSCYMVSAFLFYFYLNFNIFYIP